MLGVTFLVADTGQVIAADGAGHDSLMQVAVDNDVPGIEGECGGEMTCGTCHVYVQDYPAGYSAPTSPDELDMLDVVHDRRPQSRLSCQLPITPDIAGISVTVPTP